MEIYSQRYLFFTVEKNLTSQADTAEWNYKQSQNG